MGRRPRLLMTQDPDELANCDHMLLHLTARTWNSGEASSALATEVHRAMATEVPLLLAHEMMGVDDVAIFQRVICHQVPHTEGCGKGVQRIARQKRRGVGFAARQ